MNALIHLLGIIGVVLMWTYAWWLIPASDREARAPQAPYRALRGVIYLVLSWALWFLL